MHFIVTYTTISGIIIESKYSDRINSGTWTTIGSMLQTIDFVNSIPSYFPGRVRFSKSSGGSVAGVEINW